MPLYRLPFRAMASPCEICLDALSQAQAERYALPAQAEIARIEAKYSRYRPDSVVSRLAAQAGQGWLECDDETLALLDIAQHGYTRSRGLFDATSGVLRRAWNFQQPVLPTPEALRTLCALVDWTGLQRQGRRVRLARAGMELDFGGFGKEYATDRAAQVLRTQGLQHGYVNLGGDLCAIGPKPDGQPWSVGIQDPRHTERQIAHLALVRGAVATSGDYARFFMLQGRRYCHVLHPRTGMPVQHWRSVSVQADHTVEAGVLATTALLLEAQALAFLDTQAVSYLAIDHSGGWHSRTAGLAAPAPMAGAQ